MVKHEKKKFHPAAEIFPLLEGKEFADLVESIKKNGQQVPIQLLNDEIIDGRNRYLACLEAGEEPWFATADLDGMTPLDYVLVLNKDRRHLDPSQRSMVAARAKEYHAAQAKERQKRKPKDFVPENLPEQKGDARDKAGEALQVSGKSVDHAAKVIKGGVKELQAAVDAGQASVSSAAKVAELPEQEQRKVIETAAKHPKGMKKGIAEAAKKLSEEKKPAPAPKISGGTKFDPEEIEAVVAAEQEEADKEKSAKPKVYRADAPLPRGQDDDQFNPVPDELLEVFEARDEFHKLHRDLITIAGRVQTLVSKPEGHYLAADLPERLRSIAHEVTRGTPSLLCSEHPGWKPKGGAA